MNSGTDFLMLYKELRLRPGCAPEEFRHAYRRRVAELHPDRVPLNLDADAATRLQNLTAMYAAAMEFQKRHGRLPGEAATYRPEAASPRTPEMLQPAPSQPAEAPMSRRALVLTVLLIVAALIVGWILGASEKGNADEQSAEPLHPAGVVAEAGTAPAVPQSRIRVGMDSDRVVQIEGQPVTGSDDRWEYGPSWITFHCGAVLDWYSSPLRPLKVDSQHAPVDDVQREAAVHVPRCVNNIRSS